MTEDEAKGLMRKILADYSVGSILHLLFEALEEDAQCARLNGDEGRHEQLLYVASTLFVVGLGFNAVLPE